MKPNTHPDTGIRFGIVSANNIHPDIIEYLQREGIDLNHAEVMRQVTREVTREYEVLDFDDEDERQEAIDDEVSARLEQDNYYDDEPRHAGTYEGVTLQTTWLGGALLVWVFYSPHIVKARLCSPCVPNAGDLDNLDEDGVECYGIPEDWYVKCE